MVSDKRRAQMRAYEQTPAGRAAKARSHARYIEKRRTARLGRLNPQPLAEALNHWRMQ